MMAGEIREPSDAILDTQESLIFVLLGFAMYAAPVRSGRRSLAGPFIGITNDEVALINIPRTSILAEQVR